MEREEEERKVEWTELPRELTALILSRLETDVLTRTARLVCKSWLQISNDPSVYRTIELRCPNPMDESDRLVYENLCRRAVFYSSGHLEEITIDGFANIRLLRYVVQRSSKIKCLRLRRSRRVPSNAFNKEIVEKLPLLEELELRGLENLGPETLRAVGRCCPNLKTLKFNSELGPILRSNNLAANAIAANFPRLRSLEMISGLLTDDGLYAILHCCRSLESLNLTGCTSLHLLGNLRKICERRFKHLQLP